MILHTILFVFFFWSMYHISLEWWMVKFDVFVPPCKICFNTTNIYAYPFFGTNIYIYIKDEFLVYKEPRYCWNAFFLKVQTYNSR